ncbi:MAG: DNA-directed RNA polymerase subunit beta, partial [Clostridiaceae bacterium]|nr:DNA-directed RNA polymerase subunit beta [Clostridiaceae bacterium]
MVHEIQMGRTKRMSFARIEEVLDMPNLIEIQKNSYRKFLKEGLKDVLKDVSPITDYTGNLIMEFIDYTLETDNIKYSVEECKERDTTYSAPLKVKVRLINKETGEVKEQEIFMGDFPLMTDTGTFVINGAERVIVSQLVRSPGVYYSKEKDKNGNNLFSNTVIPYRGAWLEYETDSAEVIYVRIDRTRKLPITQLLRALGFGTDAELLGLLGEETKLQATITKDATKSREEGLFEVYKRLRPGEPPTEESASTLLNNLFFDPRRYDLSNVGRYKFNKKLSLANRIRNQIAAEDIKNINNKKVLVKAGEEINEDMAWKIQNSGINNVFVDVDGRSVNVIGNLTVDIKDYISFDPALAEINERVRYDVLKTILDDNKGAKEAQLISVIKDNRDALMPKNITKEDIVASVNYILNLDHGVGHTDDIDHLGNRRLRSVGELLQNQFRIGLARMERVVRERMTIQDIDAVTPQALINIRPVAAAIKEFFGSSQLSQFMDQTNPLAELTHKRRLSALGPGGLSRDRASFEVRDVHHSH